MTHRRFHGIGLHARKHAEKPVETPHVHRALPRSEWRKSMR
ncbi:hypothetical protein HMPREF0762_00483 [Slackia exigua ATCC 700122]|uniref:Uncharacterized protein n=1 Tax=Slackia exigua (strain ATCC 700122 / DSM 15923 / CIP 105133 / JCM 11022 / KCTC 5966 / S-7) TaxID=649764 RepID=D0WFG5_SLAES|nr:hypothetical protein HMPREF0762_00483 [Slackia exigua ATCC 700122]